MSPKYWARGLGDALRDAPEPVVEPAQSPEAIRSEALRVEAARDFETNHLCLTCMHSRICVVAAAVRSVDAEGDLVISRCGVFQSDGSDETYDESIDETSEESEAK